jgi:hypothetical protein
MNPRPIIIATCCAIALVAFVYFYGKQHFSPSGDGTVISTPPQPSEPTTVGTPKTTTETTDGGNTVGKSKTKTPTKTIDELHRREAELLEERVELKRKIAEGLTQLKLQEQNLAKQEQILAEHEADTPSTPSEKESANLQEYQKLMTLVSRAYENRPQREDFDDYSEYIDALLAFYDSIKPLEDWVKELDKEYFRSLSPAQFADIIVKAKQHLAGMGYNVSDVDLSLINEELKPQ